MDNVIQDPGFRDRFLQFGEIARGIVERCRPPALKAEDVEALDLPIDLVYERKLREAAYDAFDRGAEISVIRCGIMVRKGLKCEIVRFDQVAFDFLPRALNRVAPHECERANG